jgi:hypothetical protein
MSKAMLAPMETASSQSSIDPPSIAWRKFAIKPYAGFKGSK